MVESGITMCIICYQPLVIGNTRRVIVSREKYIYVCKDCVTREQDEWLVNYILVGKEAI